MERYRLGKDNRDRAESDAIGTKNGRRLGVGQLVYCVKWDGVLPRLLEGQIIGMDDRSLIVRGTDGLFLDALLTLPVKGVFRQALDAIRAEMQWLRWFLPHDAVAGGDATSKRSQQIAELGQLEVTMAQRCGRARSRRRGVAA
jgi:hypothetical protein